MTERNPENPSLQTQSLISCSKLTKKTLEQGEKYVQSKQ